MRFTEHRFLDEEDVRELCIRERYYTCGDNAAYKAMLNYIFDIEEKWQSVTVEHLQHIAEDIKAHSNTVYEVQSIMYQLPELCRSQFYPADN